MNTLGLVWPNGWDNRLPDNFLKINCEAINYENISYKHCCIWPKPPNLITKRIISRKAIYGAYCTYDFKRD